MKKTFFPILALILAACASAPQVIVAPEATPTSTTPPTETPLPTLTPTPVAVDGIAEDAEGDKLAYLNGEWTTLPPLDGEFAKMLQQPNGGVVAVDAKGEVVYELDAAAWEWKEVVQEPQSIIVAHTEKQAQILQQYLDMPTNHVPLTFDNGQPVPQGFISQEGPFSRVVAEVVGTFPASDYTSELRDGIECVALRMTLPDGTKVVFALGIRGYDSGQKFPINFLQGSIPESDYQAANKELIRKSEAEAAKFLVENISKLIGKDVVVSVSDNGGDPNDPEARFVMMLVNAAKGNGEIDASLFDDVRFVAMSSIAIPEIGVRP